MGLQFDKNSRIITIESPATGITVQNLFNGIRDYEARPDCLEIAKIVDAAGKDDLGGGLQVGITMRLLNWKVKFADRAGPSYEDCEVFGGNLLAVDANNQSMNPIQPAAFVTVTVTKAVSAARIADVAEWTQAEKNDLNTTLGQHTTQHTDHSSQLSEANIQIARTLGLAQENFYIDQLVFDNAGRMLSGRLRTYTDADSVGTDSHVRASYQITSTYADGLLSSYKVKQL